MTQAELLFGNQFLYSNEAYQISIENDDIRSARVFYEENKRHTWATGYKIEFNGKLIHSSKTFPSMMRRLNTLIAKWNLTREMENNSSYQ